MAFISLISSASAHHSELKWTQNNPLVGCSTGLCCWGSAAKAACGVLCASQTPFSKPPSGSQPHTLRHSEC